MISNIGELTVAQMAGPAPLPWPIPAIGVAHVFWLAD